MSTADKPLILVEVIPIIRLHDDGTFNSSVNHAISAPLAKTQLIQFCRRQLFQPGWIHQTNESQHTCEGRKEPQHKLFNNKILAGPSMLLHTDNICLGENRCGSTDDTPTTRMIVSGTIRIQTDSSDIKLASELSDRNSVSVIYLKSDNPLCESGVPCILRGHTFGDDHIRQPNKLAFDAPEIKCSVINATVVQVLPPVNIKNACSGRNWDLCTTLLIGELDYQRFDSNIHNRNQTDIDSRFPKTFPMTACYDKEIVRALTLRMSIMLLNTTWIGTTPQALSFCKRYKEKSTKQEELLNFYNLQQKCCIEQNLYPLAQSTIQQAEAIPKRISEHESVPYLLREGALLLYNSHPNSGKTTLITEIAKEVFECDAVHVLSAPAIFAKYGTSADAALETILHELILRGIVNARSPKERLIARVCVVLDHFESFIDNGTNIDSYTPVLNSMASYLNRLSTSLKSKNEFPFPTLNPMYNKCSWDTSETGFVLPFAFCLIGVMTCDDGNIIEQNKSQLSRAFDAIGGGRMHLPLPSPSTRLSAFHHVFDVLEIKLDDEATKYLPELAASNTWIFGRSFMDVGEKLRSLMDTSGTSLATKTNLQSAMDFVESSSGRSSKSSISVLSTNTTKSSSNDLFTTVGGNNEAKVALEDALALNPKKRRLLSIFGLHAPTGVLLYGPPGTGKTLLARAIAQAISTKDNKSIGGAFISLRASDIVRPEVGNSEKLIVSAFESARVNAPSVVFIDEFQALFGDRDSSGAVVGQLASTLLQCMDDITRWSDTDHDDRKTVQNGRIVVLGATNTPWMIDKAFLRPGRFDRAVHVGLPDLEEREEILRLHSCNMKLAASERVDQICKSMASMSQGFSGADLAALCRAAAVRCLSKGDDEGGIREAHFKEAFMYDIVPSSDEHLIQRISSWKI